MTRLRAALRIARRDALRAKGRTTLVICMIGVPVMAIVVMAVLIQTGDWSERDRLPYTLGHADARVYGAQHTPVRQAPLHPGAVVDEKGMDASLPTGDDRPWTTAEVTTALTARFGPGTRVVPVREDGTSELRTRLGYLRLQTYEVDLRDPLARGMLSVTAGRAPATADEVTVSQALRERGFEIGSMVQVDRRGTAKRIVGYVDQPVDGSEMILQSLPGALPASVNAEQSWLVSTGRPVGWSEVKELNRSGLALLSRAVVLNPPPASESPAELGFGRGPSTAEVAIISMVASMIVLEVVLLAGPAFAVGIRRQRRMLALVGAQGGHARQLKTIVLSGGLVLGGTAALLGAVAGLGLAGVLIPAIERVTNVAYGPFEVPWALVAAPMALGLLSGLAAAYLPARQAARMNVVAALAGRRDPVHARYGWPIAGGVLVASGIAVSVLGMRRAVDRAPGRQMREVAATPAAAGGPRRRPQRRPYGAGRRGHHGGGGGAHGARDRGRERLRTARGGVPAAASDGLGADQRGTRAGRPDPADGPAGAAGSADPAVHHPAWAVGRRT